MRWWWSLRYCKAALWKHWCCLFFPLALWDKHFSFSSLPQAWAEGTAANMQGEYCDMHHKIVPRWKEYTGSNDPFPWAFMALIFLRQSAGSKSCYQSASFMSGKKYFTCVFLGHCPSDSGDFSTVEFGCGKSITAVITCCSVGSASTSAWSVLKGCVPGLDWTVSQFCSLRKWPWFAVFLRRQLKEPDLLCGQQE